MTESMRSDMKTISFLLAALLFCSVYSCNSNNKQQDVSATIVDTTVPVESGAAAEPVYDPDPTDSIPGERYGIHSSAKATADLVRLTLQDRLKGDLEKNVIDSVSRKFIFFEYDLNDDGNKEIFVGLIGPYFCGSGGCSPYLLDHQGNVITHFTVSDYPIVVDDNKTKGWKNLFISSGGKFRVVKFDGVKYPSNPSVAPVLGVMPGDGLPRALNFVNEPYPWFRF